VEGIFLWGWRGFSLVVFGDDGGGIYLPLTFFCDSGNMGIIIISNEKNK
jgi:hypothetical protein